MVPRYPKLSRTTLVLLMLLGACRTTEDMQRDYAQTLTPKKVDAPPTSDIEAPKQIHEYKVRAYADSDYQRQSLQWATGIEAQIDRANTVLEAQFGVRLKLKEIKSWSRSGHADSLNGALGELVSIDSGDDVDWVLGFVSSLAVFAATQEQLGRAESPGQHIVLRGMFSLAEVDALNATLDRLSQQERDNVTRERRLHKQTVVLLHEWAHTLGAFHERSNDWIMSPSYDVRQSSFSPESLHLLMASLVHWGARDAAGREAWARAYRDEVTHFPPAVADEASLEEALVYSEKLVASRSPVKPAEAGRPNTAGAERRHTSSPLLERCFVAQSRSPRTDETLAACRLAAGSSDPPPEALLLLGRVFLARKQLAEAVKVLGRAEAQLSASPADTNAWVYLAQLYDRADTCTGAERAARQARGDPGAIQVVKDCVRQRRSVALPSSARGIPFEREHEYVEAVQQAQHEVDAGQVEKARLRAMGIDKAFPGSPGPALINCLSDGHGKDGVRTKASCTTATVADPEAFAPWLLLGEVASSEGRWEDAGKCLRRAIELDDAIGEAWRRLALVYSKLGHTKALDDLRARYRVRFGSVLPSTP